MFERIGMPNLYGDDDERNIQLHSMFSQSLQEVRGTN